MGSDDEVSYSDRKDNKMLLSMNRQLRLDVDLDSLES